MQIKGLHNKTHYTDTGLTNPEMSELEDSGIDISLSEEKARYSPPRQAQDRKEWEAVLNIAREDGAEDREIKVGDSIHGQVRVPHLCRKIMDTPQFQR